MKRFGMIGKLTAHPGQRDALVQHLLAASRIVAKTSGCELYFVSTSSDESDAVWVIEVWRTKADHDASLTIPEVRQLIGEARPLIAGFSKPIETAPVGGHGLTAT
jgi:quinol monooxygenase YgiN